MRFRVIRGGWILLVLFAIPILGAAVMLLWNFVLPAVAVGSRPIDYPHAVGLLILSRLLFGGFRGRGGRHGSRRWEKWSSMTAEEKERIVGGQASSFR